MINKIFPTPDTIKSAFPHSNVLILDKYSYLPYNWDAVNQIFLHSIPGNIKSYTAGIHWFNGSNVSVGYEMMLDQGKFPQTGSIYPFIQKYLKDA